MFTHCGKQGNAAVGPLLLKDPFNCLQVLSHAIEDCLDLHGTRARDALGFSLDPFVRRKRINPAVYRLV
jgi:hypothetical protein